MMTPQCSKILLISDTLTSTCLKDEIDYTAITPLNYWYHLLRRDKFDFLLVESSWSGYKNRWKYKIASYPDYPKRNNNALARVVDMAKDKGVPTVFWNREDNVHFERFIKSAKLFDHILTVDENCVKRYKEIVPASVSVNVAPFCIQPKIHNFSGFNFKSNTANFIGSYNTQIHDRRRSWQHMLFEAALRAKLPLTVIDRNSERKAKNYRYPLEQYNLRVNPSIPYAKTADIYKDYLISLNVNTIENSPTAYSRRLVEILACGGIAVSTPSLAVEKIFKDYCIVVNSLDEAIEVFSRLKHGASKSDLERAKAGSDFVLNNLTWRQFIDKVYEIIYKH
ncbi:MAG: glycosyltransferase [Campylobacteraceae bacterium]|jgi:spore maturation protein CgeB|nr:glycosyltransferase [Campylobacteraceae bacterium]